MFSKSTAKHLGLGLLIGLLVIILVTIIIVDDADAKGLVKTSGNIFDWGDNWHRPRGEVRLNLMGEFFGTESRLQGVCYDVIEEDKPYHLYFGSGLQCGSLNIEPTVGWSFRDKEFVAALRTYLEWDKWRGYSNLEYQVETQSVYYLAQLETRISSLVNWGVEVEGRGDIDDQLMSNGIGFYLAFNLQGLKRWKHQGSKLRAEFFTQFSNMGDEWKSQAGVRLIFTPKMKKHTKERRDRRGRRY